MKQMKTLNGYEIVDETAREGVDAHAGLLVALEDRITALEGSSGGKGVLYIYGSIPKQQGLAYEMQVESSDDDYGDMFNIVVDGKDSWFADFKYIELGGTGDGAGVYICFFEQSVSISGYESITMLANGEDITSLTGEYTTFTAPQVVHLTSAKIRG